MSTVITGTLEALYSLQIPSIFTYWSTNSYGVPTARLPRFQTPERLQSALKGLTLK